MEPPFKGSSEKGTTFPTKDTVQDPLYIEVVHFYLREEALNGEQNGRPLFGGSTSPCSYQLFTILCLWTYLWCVDSWRGGGRRPGGQFEKHLKDLPGDGVGGLVDGGRGHPPVEPDEDQDDHGPLGEDGGQTVDLDLPPGVFVVDDLLHDPPDDDPHTLKGSYPSAMEET